MKDPIERQAAIDALNDGAELLRRVLDDTDIVGVERAKYEWGLELIESCISDMKELPSAQPEIIHCRDCKYQEKGENTCESWNLCGYRPWQYTPTDDDEFCSHAKRREEGAK